MFHTSSTQRIVLLAAWLAGLVALVFLLGLVQQPKAVGADKAEEGIAGQTCDAREVWKQDTNKTFSIESSGISRTYTVHLPSAYDATRAYPMILAFTGKSMKIPYLEKASGLNSLPALVVYPQSLRGLSGAYSWEGAPYSPKTDDVQFIKDIISTLKKKLCVDSRQIFSVGISNGGGLSWLLSCKLSDQIAAFAMVSGAYYYPEKLCKPDRPAAILNIHGKRDRTVPYAGSNTRKLPDIDVWTSRRAALNGCKDKTPDVLQANQTTKITTWRECAKDATVQNIELFDAGHEWPAGIDPTSDKLNNRIPTAQYIWSFLRQHPLEKSDN